MIPTIVIKLGGVVIRNLEKIEPPDDVMMTMTLSMMMMTTMSRR